MSVAEVGRVSVFGVVVSDGSLPESWIVRMERVLRRCWLAYMIARSMDPARSRVTRAFRSLRRRCLVTDRRGRSARVCASDGSNRLTARRPVRCSLVLG
jgi:hypothetical protein